MDESDDLLNDNWADDFLFQVIHLEGLAVSSTNPSSVSHPQPQPQPQQPLPLVAVSTSDSSSFSPPRELSQRTTHLGSRRLSPPRPPKPDSDKDLEIERLKRGTLSDSGYAKSKFQNKVGWTYTMSTIKPKELFREKACPYCITLARDSTSKEHQLNGGSGMAMKDVMHTQRELGLASKQITSLEKECLNLKKERDKKEDQLKFVFSKSEEENPRTKRSKSVDKDFGILAPDHHKISSKFQNGVSSNDPTVETTVKAKGVKTEMDSHLEAQGFLSGDLPAYHDLSQKLLAVWGSPTDKKLGSNTISKLLVGCQRDFHILFGCMSMPSEITRKLLRDISSSGVYLHYVKDCLRTPEAAKVSHLYFALTKIADGTDVLETLIEPLLDLCGMDNVVIVHSSLCILHTLLKLLLESEKNFGTRENVFIEGICTGKDLVDSGGLEDVKNGKLFNEEIPSRKEGWNHPNASQPHVNWPNLFEMVHHISMRITEESVRVEAASIMKLLLLRSNAYFEREQFSQKIVFRTISELLKKDAGLRVKKHALRLLYLVLNCPKLLATFCCGCKECDDSSAMGDNPSASDYQNFKNILQGLADCVASRGGGLLELKINRDAILVLSFLASSGQPGLEILIHHRLSTKGVNFLMLILQLLVSEMDCEAGGHDERPEIFRERTFLIREILILLNRLVSSPSSSATILRSLTNTRDMAGLAIDVASRLSRKRTKNEQLDSMVKHTRETEIVDLARLFKKRVFTYLGDDFL